MASLLWLSTMGKEWLPMPSRSIRHQVRKLTVIFKTCSKDNTRPKETTQGGLGPSAPWWSFWTAAVVGSYYTVPPLPPLVGMKAGRGESWGFLYGHLWHSIWRPQGESTSASRNEGPLTLRFKDWTGTFNFHSHLAIARQDPFPTREASENTTKNI